jgi:hypothetical protein
MLYVKCAEHFEKVMQFAAQMGLVEQLYSRLDYLSSYANRKGCTYAKDEGKNTRCYLYSDFAPHSFAFTMMRQEELDGEWEMWFNGGLIYQGPECPADGSAPSFTVSLDKATGWFIHT